MNNRPTTIERAFEIAKSGQVSMLIDLREQPMAEGYADTNMQLSDPVLMAQTSKLMREAPRKK